MQSDIVRIRLVGGDIRPFVESLAFRLARRQHSCTHTHTLGYSTNLTSLSLPMYIVGRLFCDASVANHHHLPHDSFSMCLATRRLQLSPDLGGQE